MDTLGEPLKGRGKRLTPLNPFMIEEPLRDHFGALFRGLNGFRRRETGVSLKRGLIGGNIPLGMLGSPF